jgi:putative transferase (TIGR04331 family)
VLLVTTALEETWGTDEEILFLGEWCKHYDRKKIWQKREHTTLPYSWENRVQMYLDVEYLRELYERILPKLSVKLNEIHCTDHSARYWRIFVGIWLGFFIQILFQRWASIDIAKKTCPQLSTLLLTDRIDNQVPNDMNEFVEFMVGDRWNHHIFSEIIKFQRTINYSSLEPRLDHKETVIATSKKEFDSSLKWFLLNCWNFILKPLKRDNDLFFISSYLPIYDEIKLHLRFRQAPKYNFSKPLIRANSRKEMRLWNCDIDAQTEFESFVEDMLPLNIPSVYLEGYGSLNKQTDSLNWPQSPKLIFTSNSHIYDDLVKFYIASKVDQGSFYFIGQHGGGPHHAINFQTEHELDSCDRYLSPGVGNNYHPKIADVGQFFSRQWNHDIDGGGLLIQLAVPRYSFSVSSTVQSSDFSKYQDEQLQFIGLLNSNVRKFFTVRLHAGGARYNNSMRMWRDCFPDVTIDNGKESIYPLFSKSRLIICTYAGTTYNQTIAANAPTVIFWYPKDSQLHETTNTIFEELKRIGIFHDTPESAATHVNAIWDDVDAWWTSAEVQDVIQAFTKLYCNLTDNILDRIETEMREVISESVKK